MIYLCSKREGVYEFCVKWEDGQKVGHETQMVYYLILTTHIKVLIILDDMMLIRSWTIKVGDDLGLKISV